MEAGIYITIKMTHVGCAYLSITGFIARSVLKLKGSYYLQQPWIKVVPHVIDTLLLSCAIYLAIATQQSPFNDSWLNAKLAALLIYIGAGSIVMRFGQTQQQRIVALIVALISFSYIVIVAITRQTMPLNI